MSETKKTIRRQIRPVGTFMKMMMSQPMKPEMIQKADQAFAAAASGKWMSLKTKMRQEYIERNDGSVLRICVVTQRGRKPENATALLWMHGGGYALGLPEQCVMFADRLVPDTNTVMILPDYRKSYEAPYPAALDDCYLTLLWTVLNAKRLGIRTDQIFAGGESAGGGLAAALCMYARDLGEVNVAFQMLLYPMIDDRPTGSNTGNTSPVWDSAKNDAAWLMYKGNDADADFYCAPARQTDYTNLPAAFAIVGDADPFLDETLTYMKNLYKADIYEMHKVFKGCYHAFDMLNLGAPVTKKAAALEREAYQYAQKNFFAAQPLQEES